MEPPLITPEAFLQQVAWPEVQPSSVKGGDTSGVGNNGADDDYIVGIIAAQKAWDPRPT